MACSSHKNGVALSEGTKLLKAEDVFKALAQIGLPLRAWLPCLGVLALCLVLKATVA